MSGTSVSSPPGGRRVGLRVKLLGGFTLVLAMTALIGVLGIRSASSISSKAATVFTDATQPLADLGVVRADFNENRAFTNLHLLSGDAATKRKIEANIKANTDEVNVRLAAVEKSLTTEQEK